MIFVLHSDASFLADLRRGLEPQWPVVVTSLWSEVAGRLVHAGADDVLVTDVDMPTISGAELARIVQRYNPDLRVVFFTDQAEAVPEGAGAVVPRSGGLPLLVATLRQLQGERPSS